VSRLVDSQKEDSEAEHQEGMLSMKNEFIVNKTEVELRRGQEIQTEGKRKDYSLFVQV